MSVAIQLEGIRRTYAGASPVHALRGISLRIESGEFVAIMGPSGSGKSSLMNILGCLDQPDAGSYWLDGVEVSRLRPDELALVRNEKLGFVFQGFNLLGRTNALENVELPLICGRRKTRSRDIRARAEASLARVGLAERASHLPSELSGGQQQRVAIARALVNEPAVILADEPTGNLDSRTSVEIMGLFQGLNDAGTTIIMVTHEPDVARYCRRTLVLRDGSVTHDAPVTDRSNAAAELARERGAEELAVL